jgi:hypothetical protein
MRVTKRIDLRLLEKELAEALVSVNSLGMAFDAPGAVDGELFTYAPNEDSVLMPAEMPPEAQPVVDAHIAPPLLVEYAGSQPVDAFVTTTDDQPHEVFRFPCAERRLYKASLEITGIDRANFVSLSQEGRFVWKRATGNAIMVGITVVSSLPASGAPAWQASASVSGTDVVFTVRGAAGRTIDWMLVGTVGAYAPGGTGA